MRPPSPSCGQRAAEVELEIPEKPGTLLLHPQLNSGTMEELWGTSENQAGQ